MPRARKLFQPRTHMRAKEDTSLFYMNYIDFCYAVAAESIADCYRRGC